MVGDYGAYVGPMLIHVRALGGYVGAIFGPWRAYVQPRTACSFLAFTRPKRNTPFLDHVGTMLGVYGAYVGPMLIHVRLLEAMLGPSSSHVKLMLSQEHRVPFKNSNFEGVTHWKLVS